MIDKLFEFWLNIFPILFLFALLTMILYYPIGILLFYGWVGIGLTILITYISYEIIRRLK